jgi:hypothetical protein
MSYTDQQKAVFMLKFVEEGYTYSKFKTRVRQDAHRRNPHIPTENTVKRWLDSFRATGSVHGEQGKNKSK